MESFDPKGSETVETKEEAKVEEQAVELVSRLQVSDQIWDEALVLSTMLGYCRPNLSKTERKFVGKFIYPAGVKFDKQILRMLCIGRNKGMSGIICVQDITILNSAGRNNINFMLFFKLNTDDRVEKVIKHYLNSYMPKNIKMVDKIRWYRENTENHHFILLDTLNGCIYRTKRVE